MLKEINKRVENMLVLNMRSFTSFCHLVKTSRCLDLNSSKVGSVDFFRFRSRQVFERKASLLPDEDKKGISIPVVPSTILPLVNEGEKIPMFSVQKDNDLMANEKLFKEVIASHKTRRFREKKQRILLEGTELINEGLNAGLQLSRLFYSKENSLCLLNNYRDLDSVNKYRISDKTMRELIDNMSSSKIIAECNKPLLSERHKKFKGTMPVTLLCSDIRDPSNMASVLTLAAAAGCKKVLLLKGCVDVWERKVLRSANGLQFHFPIINNIAWDEIQGHFPENATFYVADSSSDVDINDSQLYCEDVNKHGNTYQDSDVPRDDMPELNERYSTSPNVENELELQETDIESLACKLYSEISFPNEEVFLYIGGETVGINQNVGHLAKELNALKIKLPLANGMESLNVCVALSIILFEMKRQFTKKYKTVS